MCQLIQFWYSRLVFLDLPSPKTTWNDCKKALTDEHYSAMNKNWRKASVSLLQPAQTQDLLLNTYPGIVSVVSIPHEF